MKKTLYVLFLLQSVFLFSQNTNGFVYESTIRNSSNQIVVNQYISLRFTIRQNSNTGTIVYSETQNPYSNTSGNISVVIGKGVAKTGVFSQINWALATHYLDIEFFTGATCKWISISSQTNGQIVSKCDGIYTIGSCNKSETANLVWSDEFDGSGAINSTNWFQQTQLPAGENWYNGELQHYTNQSANAFVNSGILTIVAKKESYTNQNVTKQYTSARLNSKFAFKYGRIEVRAKLPSGAGTWPAIWMLGKNINEDGGFYDASNGTTNWPACGEIDIMEHWGTNQNYVQSAMHTPSSSGGTVNLGGQTISTASSEFHVYALDWTAEKMVFSVDNVIHYTYNPQVKNASTWPFDAEQYILLNVAIQSSITSNFTQAAMEIDYVRVYQ